jgi:hypothetical protein
MQIPNSSGSEYSLTEEARYQRQELSTQEFNLESIPLRLLPIPPD